MTVLQRGQISGPDTLLTRRSCGQLPGDRPTKGRENTHLVFAYTFLFFAFTREVYLDFHISYKDMPREFFVNLVRVERHRANTGARGRTCKTYF